MEVSIATKDNDGSAARPQRPTLTHPEDPAVTELRAANKLAQQLLARLVDTGHMDDTTRTAIHQFSGTLANLHGTIDKVDAEWYAQESERLAAEAARADAPKPDAQ